MTFYRRNLPHLQRDDKPHFITFVTKRRRVLPGWARDLVLNCCLHDHQIRYLLYAAVVMPDHAHLILTPLVDQQRQAVVSIASITQAIKSASAHVINRRLGKSGTVWQEESFDHVLRIPERLDEKSAYIAANPVRGGLVADWREYP
jgi:REP element-mobilizing transposase RayT